MQAFCEPTSRFIQLTPLLFSFISEIETQIQMRCTAVRPKVMCSFPHNINISRFVCRPARRYAPVDESQDLNECQVDWMTRQRALGGGKQIFFVGDAVQTIYG